MQNITPTTNTVENKWGTFEQTVWTVQGYTLTRIVDINAADEPADWRLQPQNRDMPDITDQSYLPSEGVNYGVNWSAQGTRTPAEARTYALGLLQAAEAAEIFNKIRNEQA